MKNCILQPFLRAIEITDEIQQLQEMRDLLTTAMKWCRREIPEEFDPNYMQKLVNRVGFTEARDHDVSEFLDELFVKMQKFLGGKNRIIKWT